jgi:hypothetical protein
MEVSFLKSQRHKSVQAAPLRAVRLVALTFASCLTATLCGQVTPAPLESTRTLNDGTSVRELSLDGDWRAGLDRRYDRTLHVPGLAGDPSKITLGTLWYKRTVDLPAGDWTDATLTLKGARFAPDVYVNGAKVSSAEGGMAATVHRFPLPTGRAFTLEIALHSLHDLSPSDASAVPAADLWRSNVSSYLWDSVVLRLHGRGEIARITPFGDLAQDSVLLRWELKDTPPPNSALSFKLLDESGAVLVAAGPMQIDEQTGSTIFKLQHQIAPWSPERPQLYRLRSELTLAGHLIDAREQSFGLRSFAVKGLGFELNGEPYHLRMGTVVWHRWTRDPEAAKIAFDPVWFEHNVVQRLKGLGANSLRFHLGLPPEELLDLADRDGLAVQMEWPFFHGIAASPESLEIQWQAWLDTAMRHPSVVILQAWNETGGDQVKAAGAVLDTLLQQYPPLVLDHRDVTPVHKYWWSLFENLGLYYDSAAQFGAPVMVDEFGGDYLDGKGDPGGYPATIETFQRFLGRDNTKEERLQLQSDANARVAEYWRRLGVAGFAPFCILGSPQDGNHWFLGPTNIASPTAKPVWTALAAAWAPQSLSLELWNRNFLPGDDLRTPLWFFNEGNHDRTFHATVHVIDVETSREAMPPVPYEASIKAFSAGSLPVDVPLPNRVGEWRIEAHLSPEADEALTAPIVSSWRIRTFAPQIPASLAHAVIGVADDEAELRSMLRQQHLNVVDASDPHATILIGSHATWQRLTDGPATLRAFQDRLQHHTSIVLLDAGPQPLGVGYSSGTQRGGPLEGAPTIANPSMLQRANLFGGVTISFHETAEPESTIHQSAVDKQLWQGVPHEATWLWNGLRGGLIVPAADMTVDGLGGDAVLSAWQTRGADPAGIKSGSYFAYELAGYYAFSEKENDDAVSATLRKRVKFIVEDAPALAMSVNPDAPIAFTDLGKLYTQSTANGQTASLTPLANAGKGLSRTPIVKLTFGPDSGSVVISQLLTAGRLANDPLNSPQEVYHLRYDPVAVQFVLNMLNASLDAK